MKVCPPYETNYGYHCANEGSDGDVTDGTNVFYMAGEMYTNGFGLDINSTNTTQALFNIKGEYSVLEFDLGHVDGTSDDTLNLMIIADGVVIATFSAQHTDLVKHYVVDIRGARQLAIVGAGQNNSMWGSHYCLANITVN